VPVEPRRHHRAARGVMPAVGAVGVAGVVEVDLAPITGIVAAGTLAFVVTGRSFFGVTVYTIGEVVVAEVDVFPTIGIVTAAAVLAVVAGRGIFEVAVGTLVDRVAFVVIELGFVPGLGVVAARALVGVVVGGRIGSVAALAVLETGMVEVGVSPTLGGVVAGGAVIAIVVEGLGVAILAVLVTEVEEDVIVPVVDIDMALLAVAEVVSVWELRLVAGEAVVGIGVIESGDGPVVGILVAVGAGLGVKGMDGGSLVDVGGFLLVAGEAFDDVLVVESDGIPTDGIMAVLAGAVEVLGVIEVGVGDVFLREGDGEDGVGSLDDGLEGVAIGAVGGGADILAAGVAGDAVGGSVSALEGIDGVVDLLSEEGDGHGRDDGGRFGDGAHGVRREGVFGFLLEEGVDARVEEIDGLAAGLINGEDDQFSLMEQGIQVSEDEGVLIRGEALAIGQEGGESLVESDGGSLDALGVLSVGQVGEAAFGQGERQASGLFALMREGEAGLLGEVLDGIELIAGVERIGFRQIVEAGEGRD